MKNTSSPEHITSTHSFELGIRQIRFNHQRYTFSSVYVRSLREVYVIRTRDMAFYYLSVSLSPRAVESNTINASTINICRNARYYEMPIRKFLFYFVSQLSGSCQNLKYAATSLRLSPSRLLVCGK
jgi:hypothetical protein